MAGNRIGSTQFFNLWNIRYYCTKRGVRVRFAPSPTGNLHLGGLRTALYNYLFARNQNGKFILRIEDTDRKRTIPEAIEKITYDLSWCDIIPDEGPKFAGNFGPYLQSQREELYKEFAEKLIKKEAAYYCFCSEQRLALLRNDALKRNMVPKYDNRCRSLTKEEIASKLSSNVAKCIRFKLSDSEPFNDLIYGKVLHEVEFIEGDPVILKKDGWPTYHLANVVDDYTMNISHVIRGVEWLQSTNKHLMIYSALGCTPPQFAHMPLLLNADGSKFSKRHKNLSIESLRERGILPKTLINFISYTSSGFDVKKNLIEIKSLEELVKKFDLRNIGTTSSRLPLDRLEEFNRLEIKRQINSPHEIDDLVDDIRELVKNTFKKNDHDLELENDHIKEILRWSVPRITYLKDLVKKDLEFLWIRPNKQHFSSKDIDILKHLQKDLHSLAFDDKAVLNNFLKNYSHNKEMPFKELMSLLRSVISGLQSGPGVAEMLLILGKKTSLGRIERAVGEMSSLRKNV